MEQSRILPLAVLYESMKSTDTLGTQSDMVICTLIDRAVLPIPRLFSVLTKPPLACVPNAIMQACLA